MHENHNKSQYSNKNAENELQYFEGLRDICWVPDKVKGVNNKVLKGDA